MVVKVRKHGIIHKLVQCHDCDWDYSYYDKKDTTTKIRQHVQETGHTVIYEYGVSQLYEKGDE